MFLLFGLLLLIIIQLRLSPVVVDVKARSSANGLSSSCINLRKCLRSWHDHAQLRLKTLPHSKTAFLLMAKQTVIAETHAAERTIELLTMKDFVPAFAA